MPVDATSPLDRDAFSRFREEAFYGCPGDTRIQAVTPAFEKAFAPRSPDV